PSTSCPAAATVQRAGDVPVGASDYASFVAAGGTASDNCSASSALTVSHIDATTPGSCANKFSIVRTYTVTDECGNFATCTQNITVNDNTAPSITCPAPVTVQCAMA